MKLSSVPQANDALPNSRQFVRESKLKTYAGTSIRVSGNLTKVSTMHSSLPQLVCDVLDYWTELTLRFRQPKCFQQWARAQSLLKLEQTMKAPSTQRANSNTIKPELHVLQSEHC